GAGVGRHLLQAWADLRPAPADDEVGRAVVRPVEDGDGPPHRPEGAEPGQPPPPRGEPPCPGRRRRQGPGLAERGLRRGGAL
ncbi:MAG: hypothetical protein AVDCRST_MAG20-220, partial [uncultured Acidimicrobiales bacterium]